MLERGGVAGEGESDPLVLTETRKSRGGDDGGGVHYVVRGAKCYVGYSMGYDLYLFKR